MCFLINKDLEANVKNSNLTRSNGHIPALLELMLVIIFGILLLAGR